MNLSRRHLLLLAIIAVSVLLPGLGRITMERQQELRVALCARQMVESGDWIVPRFQQQVRLRKPPLMYWVVGAVYKVTGQDDSAGWTRVPGVLSGILLVLLVYAMGTRFFSQAAGAWSALSLVGCYGFIRHARLAETDVTLALFTTLAIFLIFLGFQHKRRWLWLLAGVAMGFGFLTKGPAAIAMPLLALLLFGLGVDEGRKNFSWLGFLLLIVVAGAIAAPWYYLIHQFTLTLPAEAEQLKNELSDTFAKTKHPGTIFYYLYTLPRMMIPAGVLLPFALVAFFKQGEKSPERMFVAGWFASSFLLLSVIASKQSHYAILLLPVSCLLIGRWVAELIPKPPEKHLPHIAIGLAMLTVLYAYVIYPKTDGLSATPKFLAEVRAQSADAKTTHVVGINSAVFDFYLRRHVDNIDHTGKAHRRAKTGDAIVTIEKSSKLDLETLPTVEPLIDSEAGKYRYLFYRK